MLEFFKKKVSTIGLVQFKWRKKKLQIEAKNIPSTKEVKDFARYRNEGEGFIAWCNENVNLAIYKEGATVPTWMPMSELPDVPNPETGRSYKQMWESQQEIVREALRMKDGRFVYRLVVFCWQRGDGKCHGKGTEILMYDGTVKKVEDVKIGDKLMGDDNTPRKVLSLARGKEELFEVVPNRGEPFAVTGDHKLTLKKIALTRNRSGEAKRDSGHGDIIDITVNDFKKKSKYFQNSHMLFRVPIDWPKKDVPIDPYFLGLWLGDGNSDSPAITTMDEEVVSYLAKYAEKRGMIVSKRSSNSRANLYYLKERTRKTGNRLTKELSENNLLGNKHIPKDYKINSKKVRMQVLAGLIDADGHRNRNSIEITLKRKDICKDVVFIARSLGFHAEMKEVQKGIKSTGFVGTYYRVGISGDCSQIPLRVERKKCEPRSDWKDVLASNIKEIRSVGEQDYYGFMIDGNHRYVMGDFTVTHNSLLACLIQLWKFFCFPRQQIMLGANSKDQVKFVHYDIMKDIILNSPKLLKIIGVKNLQEKEMRLVDSKKRVISIVRSISSFSGIVSNITGYTFSEIFDMKNPKFFVQLDGSIRNIPNAMGVIDSTVSEKTHILYQLYQSSIENLGGAVYFSYRCSPKGIHEDFMNPQMTQKQLEDYKTKFPPQEFARYFKNVWDTGVKKIFTAAQLEAMHYYGIIGADPKDYIAPVNMILGLEKKDELLLEIQTKRQNNIPVPDGEEERIKSKVYSSLVPMRNFYQLDLTTYMCEMASRSDLQVLSELFDTDWVIGVGIDRADPLKSKPDVFEKPTEDVGEKIRKKKTTGARTMMVYVAKGLAGSRSDYTLFTDKERINKYIYIILGVKHCATSTIEEIKSEILIADEEYDGVEVVCSERWGMFDIITWCEERNIEIELISPTVDKQREGFGELYLAVSNGRIKVAPIGYYGSKQKNILMEEMGAIESDPDKIWYGSPEKNKSGGIQDDTVFASVWGVYGLRFKGIEDMRPRMGRGQFLGEFFPNKDLHGKY